MIYQKNYILYVVKTIFKNQEYMWILANLNKIFDFSFDNVCIALTQYAHIFQRLVKIVKKKLGNTYS